MTDDAEVELEVGGRPADGADFRPRRLARGRTPPLLVWIVALGGLVALGVAGRSGDGTAGSGGERATPAASRPAAVQDSSSTDSVVVRPTARPITGNPSASSGAGPIRLEVVRTSASIFVHADIHLERVAWVFVQVQTDSGRVAGWASMSFPGAVDPPASPGDRLAPAMRFDVELVVPEDMRAGRLWTQVNVYDNLGQRVGTTRLPIAAPGAFDPRVERELLRGFRPTGPPWNRVEAGEG